MMPLTRIVLLDQEKIVHSMIEQSSLAFESSPDDLQKGIQIKGFRDDGC